MSTEIRVALVYQQDEGSTVLRAALANAGVAIAIERRASELAAADLLSADVDAIVVNLDPELEDLLDQVTEALDSATQPVIFNDPAASSDLSGWDRARWLRHLSAKLKGRTDVTPPAPPGAQSIPMPAPRPVAAAVVPVPATPEPAVASATVEAEEPQGEISLADLDLMFAGDQPEATSVKVSETLVLGEDLGELDALFDPQPVAEEMPAAPAEVAVEPAPVGSDDLSADIDLDALFGAPSQTTPEVAAATSSELNDLDALFSEPPEASRAAPAATVAELNDLDALFSEPPAAAETAPMATSAELNDLDALFREFEESSRTAEQAPAPAPAPAPAKPEAPKIELGLLASNWSLEEIEEKPAEQRSDTGKLVAEWRLDAPAVPKSAVPVAPKPPAPPPAKTSAPAIPADLEASLALSNLQLVDDVAETPAPADNAAALGDIEALDLSGIGFEDVSAPATASAAAADELSFADLSFDLDLGAEAPAPAAQTSSRFDADLGDLDALFEPAAPAKAPALALPDLNRVFVLGASIGGPEAIKAFLARLPASVPAAFIVAQHMGSEFLEMMAAQLDAATALAVRYPKAGERLRHGEAIVAPANEHLTLDAEGRIQLSAAPSGSPYSPSIDQLARDAADRFGDHATLILFSGMGTDAVEGGRYLAGRGGQVWAQDRASCVIATMIDSAKSQGLLRFEGSPVQLAERVLELVS